MRIVRRTAAAAAALIGLFASGCLDDRTVSPNDGAGGPTLRLGFQASIIGAAAGQTVRIRAFYRRIDGTAVTLESSPGEVGVEPGVPKQVAVVVKIAQCLGDPLKVGGTPTQCAVGIDLTLMDENGNPIDEQITDPTPPLPPGTTTTINGTIVFTVVSQVNLGVIPVLREGDARTLTASALDTQGNPITSRSFTWTSDNPSVLTVDATTGAATAVAAGTARVTASTGLRNGTATVRVIRKVTSVSLSPDPASAVRAAESLTLTATPKAAGGVDAGDLADRTITWAVTNPDGATQTAIVSNQGVLTATYPGNADVTVTIDGVAKTIRVPIVAASIAIQSSGTVLVVDTRRQLGVTVLDANDAPLPDVPVTWTSSDPDVATVDANGLVTAVKQGLAIITATGGGGTGQTPMHVTTSTLDIQPATLKVFSGATGTLTASNAIGPITWTTADPLIATVSPDGVVTGLGLGTVVISATAGSGASAQFGAATVTVIAAAVEITPDSASIFEGDSIRFSAVVKDAGGGILKVPITWSVDDPNVAPIDDNGGVYGSSAGITTVRAFGGGQEGRAALVVEAASGVVVSPYHTPLHRTQSSRPRPQN